MVSEATVSGATVSEAMVSEDMVSGAMVSGATMNEAMVSVDMVSVVMVSVAMVSVAVDHRAARGEVLEHVVAVLDDDGHHQPARSVEHHQAVRVRIEARERPARRLLGGG